MLQYKNELLDKRIFTGLFIEKIKMNFFKILCFIKKKKKKDNLCYVIQSLVDDRLKYKIYIHLHIHLHMRYNIIMLIM